MADAATTPQLESETEKSAAAWDRVLSLPCLLTVDLPVVFTAKAVLEMGLQTVIPTQCRVGSDIPLRVNGELIAWGEFGVGGNRLVLRLTELA
jgi:flagellar motor switch/type III secretory pathway protein FliN